LLIQYRSLYTSVHVFVVVDEAHFDKAIGMRVCRMELSSIRFAISTSQGRVRANVRLGFNARLCVRVEFHNRLEFIMYEIFIFLALLKVRIGCYVLLVVPMEIVFVRLLVQWK
jgi:hypothetical protein